MPVDGKHCCGGEVLKEEKGRSALDHYAAGHAWWETSISDIKKNKIQIRGYRIEDLIGNISYPALLLLLLTGEIPRPEAAGLLEAALVAGCDHGPRSPSIAVARMAATCGISFNSCVATGINVLGDIHGGAGEKAMSLFYKIAGDSKERNISLSQAVEETCDKYFGEKSKFPGYGHQQHDNDPRVARLFDLARECAGKGVITGDYIRAAGLLQEAIARRLGKVLTINVDGATAAVQCELGIPAEVAKGLFSLSRGAGIMAHAYEELMSGVRVKGPCPLDEKLVRYTGPPERSLDDRFRKGGNGE